MLFNVSDLTSLQLVIRVVCTNLTLPLIMSLFSRFSDNDIIIERVRSTILLQNITYNHTSIKRKLGYSISSVTDKSVIFSHHYAIDSKVCRKLFFFYNKKFQPISGSCIRTHTILFTLMFQPKLLGYDGIWLVRIYRWSYVFLVFRRAPFHLTNNSIIYKVKDLYRHLLYF